MISDINILMLGGAKRVSVGRMFIRAAQEAGYNARLFSYELSDKIPIREIAHIIIGKKWADADVLNDLQRIIAANNISLMIPFVDPAIEIAARIAQTDTSVFVPSPSTDICRKLFDKSYADLLFRQAGIPVPPDVSVTAGNFPIIAKPRCGSASKGILLFNSPTDIPADLHSNDYLFQKYIADRREFTVDCYIARDGHIKALVPRERLEVVGGEVSRTVTVDYPQLEKLSAAVISRLSLTGAVTLQFIEDRLSHELMLMEINPRLGGGVVCSVHAGADIPSMIIRDCLRLPVTAARWRRGTGISRYMQEVVVS